MPWTFAKKTVIETMTLAAPPGTGSCWLQGLLRERFGFTSGPTILGRRDKWKYDRHAPGDNVTVTIRRNVDEWLRTWFVRFRLKTGHGLNESLPYLAWFNSEVDYGGPDFKVWLDAYLERAPGMATKVFELFDGARYMLRTEDLVMGTIRMLKAEGVTFEEQVVRDFPRRNVTGGPHVEGWKDWGEKPEWPVGYREKVLAAG